MRIYGQVWALTIDDQHMRPHIVLAEDVEDAIKGLDLQLDRNDTMERLIKAERLSDAGIAFRPMSWGNVTRQVLE